jgi:geranylgeranyl pyrophosphate synthase
MQSALVEGRQESAISEGKPEMALLPGLCCQAAGGDARWADHIAAAWMLFYAAADIMDSLQDQDDPAPWWGDLGPAAALSASTGLFFSAASVLNQASFPEITKDTAPELIQDFYDCFMIMSSGQYEDLRKPEPSIAQYWETATAKSGVFFSLACRSGARLALGVDPHIEYYGQYGRHLGLLMQILDDLEDLQFLTQPAVPVEMEKLTRSLPVIYTMQMISPAAKEQLQTHLLNAPNDPQAAADAAHMIEENGAVIYLLSEIERNKGLAVDHLTKARAQSPAREILQGYLERLVSLP